MIVVGGEIVVHRLYFCEFALSMSLTWIVSIKGSNLEESKRQFYRLFFFADEVSGSERIRGVDTFPANNKRDTIFLNVSKRCILSALDHPLTVDQDRISSSRTSKDRTIRTRDLSDLMEAVENGEDSIQVLVNPDRGIKAGISNRTCIKPRNSMANGLRKAIARKTVDYNSSVLNMLETRLYQKDFRCKPHLQPDPGYYINVS